MSGQIPNDRERFLFLLNEAILKNTVRPRPHEEQKMSISKSIRCSPEIEGDSQLGIVLFCGIASIHYGIPKNEIMDYLGVDSSEFTYKVNKFIENTGSAGKLPQKFNGAAFDIISNNEIDLIKIRNKVKLVKNYVQFYSHRHGILFSKAGNV